MAPKIKLLITLAVLSAMTVDQLTEQYNELYPTPPDPSVTREALLEQILEVADPADETGNVPKMENPPPPPAPSKLQEGVFKYGKKKYKSILAKVFIPGLGERTALEIAADEDAQKYLIKEGCIGSVIEEVV